MKKLIIGIIAVALALVGGVAYANPSNFFSTAQTAAATTTYSYLSAGAGTTTLSMNYVRNSNTSAINSALLTFQIAATNTVTGAPVRVRIEYSNDNVDWYSKTVENNANATTTQISAQEYAFSTATSTTYVLNGTSSTAYASIPITAPLRYVRAVFYVPIGGSSIGLWAELTPVKEVDYN
jgi:hypothetical protein